ncbi:MAG: hypothetical protein AB7F64_08760 [Gammaproteobacteria bacterium]
MGGQAIRVEQLTKKQARMLGTLKKKQLALAETIHQCMNEKSELEAKRVARLEFANRYSMLPGTCFREAREMHHQIQGLERKIRKLEWEQSQLASQETFQKAVAKQNQPLGEFNLDEFRTHIEKWAQKSKYYRTNYSAILSELDLLVEKLSEHQNAVALVDEAVNKILVHLKQTRNKKLLTLVGAEENGIKLKTQLQLLCLEKIMDRMLEVEQCLPYTENHRASRRLLEMRGLELITALLQDKLNSADAQNKEKIELEYLLARKKLLNLKIEIHRLEQVRCDAAQEEFQTAVTAFKNRLFGKEDLSIFASDLSIRSQTMASIKMLAQDVFEANAVLLTTLFYSAFETVHQEEQRKMAQVIPRNLRDEFQFKIAVVYQITKNKPFEMPEGFVCSATKVRTWEKRQEQKALIDEMDAFANTFQPVKPSRLQYGLNWLFGAYAAEIERYNLLTWYKGRMKRRSSRLKCSDYYKALSHEDLGTADVTFEDPGLAKLHAQVKTTSARASELMSTRLQHDNTKDLNEELSRVEEKITHLTRLSFEKPSETNNKIPVCESYFLKLTA